MQSCGRPNLYVFHHLFVWNTFRFSNIIWCSKFDFYGLFVIIITFILLHQTWPVVLVHWSGHQSSHWMHLVPCSRRDILSWKTAHFGAKQQSLNESMVDLTPVVPECIYLFNHKYIYWKRVNSCWYGGPHLISDFDFIISVLEWVQMLLFCM